MIQEEFNAIVSILRIDAQDVRRLKQPEYTLENSDILNNFKESAKRAGVDPMQVWSIFLTSNCQAFRLILRIQILNKQSH